VRWKVVQRAVATAVAVGAEIGEEGQHPLVGAPVRGGLGPFRARGAD
jgi:hypothetical protein